MLPQTNTLRSEPAIEWKESLTRLAKELATGFVSAFVRGVSTVAFFIVLNLGFAAWLLFALLPLSHGTRDSLLFALCIFVLFAPFVGVAILFAHKQGLQRLIAAAVESQGPTISRVGTHLLTRFFAEETTNLKEAHATKMFDRVWQRYLRTRTEAPWPVRFVLSQLSARIPIGNIVDELAASGTPAEQLPQRAMEQVVLVASDRKLRPSWKPTLILLVANIIWFTIVRLGSGLFFSILVR